MAGKRLKKHSVSLSTRSCTSRKRLSSYSSRSRSPSSTRPSRFTSGPASTRATPIR